METLFQAGKLSESEVRYSPSRILLESTAPVVQSRMQREPTRPVAQSRISSERHCPVRKLADFARREKRSRSESKIRQSFLEGFA